MPNNESVPKPMRGRRYGKRPDGASVKKNIKRLIIYLFKFNPVLLPITLFCIFLNACISALPAFFQQRVISIIEENFLTGSWESCGYRILSLVKILALMYLVSISCGFTYNRLMAIITQGSLSKFRKAMFESMQDLPIGYFDRHGHGDIMSTYTNDVDALRQMISQSMPNLISSSVSIITVFSLMLYYSLWLTLVVVIGVYIMLRIVSRIGGGSARNFVKQQEAVGKTEGFIEEMMKGQKVVKVFNHEKAAMEDFDRLNDALYEASEKANSYANTLMPILGNIGNIMYVVLAVFGGVLLALRVPNISISGLALSISITVPFLNMERQFAGQIGQVSNQVNAIVMASAGAGRIFALMDEKKEENDGFVTLVRCTVSDGKIKEEKDRTGLWAWKKTDKDGRTEYREMKGDVRFKDVDFSYEKGKQILKNINLYAEPGQRVAFVGATGAGKTTITNLINRFYEIEKGSITYDGIDIGKIRKQDLRRSLGIILQDTVLFTDTVMENIRYGKLDATDEDCIRAAKLSGADEFIRKLPDGYRTYLTSNGSNLSQGQRQLLSIARAAVADPPVMIMDEATSSIDTHTEAVVQKGMDALMKGRTVFVIAHRLSTVQNADVIMVLDHGSIIERGSHEELIRQKGQYYRLYTGDFELE